MRFDDIVVQQEMVVFPQEEIPFVLASDALARNKIPKRSWQRNILYIMPAKLLLLQRSKSAWGPNQMTAPQEHSRGRTSQIGADEAFSSQRGFTKRMVTVTAQGGLFTSSSMRIPLVIVVSLANSHSISSARKCLYQTALSDQILVSPSPPHAPNAVYC